MEKVDEVDDTTEFGNLVVVLLGEHCAIGRKLVLVRLANFLQFKLTNLISRIGPVRHVIVEANPMLYDAVIAK